MIISIDWIKDFVALPDLSPKDFYNRFTLACAEVEQVEEKGLHLKKIQVVKITAIRKHPEADKLNLVTFDTGKETREVVCGAQNVRVGLKVPYAPIGTVLPGNFELTPKKIRGILSEGMLCSSTELELPGDGEGLLELSEEAPLGLSLDKYLKITPDVLLHIDNKSLTHRPDLWGHFGLAREFSAIFKVPLKAPENLFAVDQAVLKVGNGNSPLKIVVEDGTSTLAYYGISLSGLKVAPSPEWMQRRLLSVGLRPINNLVDISNYVMLELGHPLHIFDRDRIAGNQVVIKSIKANEEFLTLDEQKRILEPGDTVICDKEKTLVLAGIMGGASSGVQDHTTNIFIEVANWKSAPTRRTSTRLGLRTESSQRFEKSLDTYQCQRVLWRTVKLVMELCPGAKIEGNLEYGGPEIPKYEGKVVTASFEKFNRYLGTNLGEKDIVEILESLEFKVKKEAQELKITIPSFRATKDVEIFDDLVEEIGRIIGYDSITPVSPRQDVLPASLSPQQKMTRKIQDFLSTRLGAFEIMSYPLVGEKLLKDALWPQVGSELKLKNALSQDHDRMRPSLIPSLLEKLLLNQKYSDRFNFFEIGRSYLPHKDPKVFCEERFQLGAVIFDREEVSTLHLVNAAEDLLRHLGVGYQMLQADPKTKSNLVDSNWPGLHPKEQVHFRIMGKLDGVIFTLHPWLMKKLKMRGEAALMVLDLTAPSQVIPKEKINYKPLAKSQASHFDLTVMCSPQTSMLEIQEKLKGIKIDFYQKTTVLDVYAPDQEQKAVTLRCHFHDPEKSLSGEYLQKSLQQIVSILAQAGFHLKT